MYTVIKALGFGPMTPAADSQRAGNVCFMAEDIESIRQALEQQPILVWGAYTGYGWLRISAHLYNDSTDVERCIAALKAG